MDIQWKNASEVLPEDGEKVYVRMYDNSPGYMFAHAYFYLGQYWQDANVPTKRYSLNSVGEWAKIPEESQESQDPGDVDLQQKVEALEQYMSVVQKAIVMLLERMDKIENTGV